ETVKDTNTSALDRQHDPTGTCGDRLNQLDFSVTNVPVKKPNSTKNPDDERRREPARCRPSKLKGRRSPRARFAGHSRGSGYDRASTLGRLPGTPLCLA